MPTQDQIRLLALCKLPPVKGPSPAETVRLSWHLVAREAQRPGGLQRLLAGEVSEASREARDGEEILRHGLADLDRISEGLWRDVAAVEEQGVRLTTVLDEDYPTNLRLIFNLPPFLFYRGTLKNSDAHSVAVVGTRDATAEGLERASSLAEALTQLDVTVLSGLARGIDTAAHRATLAAGGRTIAVLGSGIMKVYPPENAGLADEIGEQGAVVSQFWPDAPPARHTFPRRNVVTSGMGQGTVVIEASSTSGAKMQARLALEHGKKVFLLRSLVADHAWARKYLERGAVEVGDPLDIVRHLRPADVMHSRSRQVHQEALRIS